MSGKGKGKPVEGKERDEQIAIEIRNTSAIPRAKSVEEKLEVVMAALIQIAVMEKKGKPKFPFLVQPGKSAKEWAAAKMIVARTPMSNYFLMLDVQKYASRHQQFMWVASLHLVPHVNSQTSEGKGAIAAIVTSEQPIRVQGFSTIAIREAICDIPCLCYVNSQDHRNRQLRLQ